MFFPVLYEASIRTAWSVLRLMALFHPKWKAFVRSRNLPLPAKHTADQWIWMHCASLGEYEQGRPVLEAIRNRQPNARLLVSFFSPSGYNIVRKDPLPDAICYLPIDTQKNVRLFLDHFRPGQAIFVKYDFWFNLLRELNRRSIPTVFIAVHLHPGHYLFSRIGKPVLNQLRLLQAIFTQDASTKTLLVKKGFSHVLEAGDPRIDRVLTLPQTVFSDERIEGFVTGEKPVLVIGSSWPEDIDLFASLDEDILNRYRWIIAPHQVSDGQIEYIRRRLPSVSFTLYSERSGTPIEGLIVDRIGLLKYLYRYAQWVYIGGGFGKGIHNTLEPAAYGKPVLFGPKFTKFPEAREGIRLGAFFSVPDADALKNVIRQLEIPDQYQKAYEQIENYLRQNQGATGRILSELASSEN